ncbi:hypothetical protein KI387_020029 [Taxus chinensis]|uniref:O-fucosyltransferase family protein n=1 Tax=Taxus chinensis TaxID=29808 RepID=A0AA38LDY0_TAXCH|nr:hypothetical protein KI387_020029 [Taxus chinensis]
MALQRASKATDTGLDVKDDSRAESQPTPSSPGRMYSHLLLLTSFLSIGIIALAISSSISGTGSSVRDTRLGMLHVRPSGYSLSNEPTRYLYWGDRIDCPGKHCAACEGLGHQESSLRCALEEAMLLNRLYLWLQIRDILEDYDAIHVRRGDKIKVRKDRLGVHRTLHPHLDRDTRPEAILQRIASWVPEGRMVFIASNERTPGFFSPLSVKYRLAYSSNFTNILEPVVQNNYHLFMLERLVLADARRLIKTFKEESSDLSLTDDPKKNLRDWKIPVYTLDDTSL